MMPKTTESVLGMAVMRVLAGEKKGDATVRVLVKKVPNFVNLSVEDKAPSLTRPLEEMWEQRVRNLKSHDKTEGNVIAEGLVEHVSRGKYRLTDAGWQLMKKKGYAPEYVAL
jgi:hypothetical protein